MIAVFNASRNGDSECYLVHCLSLVGTNLPVRLLVCCFISIRSAAVKRVNHFHPRGSHSEGDGLLFHLHAHHHDNDAVLAGLVRQPAADGPPVHYDRIQSDSKI